MSWSIFRSAALLTAAFALLASSGFGRQPVPSESSDPTGKYALRDGGYVVVSMDDMGGLDGFYERNGEFGRLSGRLEAGVVSATWVQEKGSRACEASVDGSKHWGSVTLSPTQTGELDLAWGACEGATTQLETAR